MTNDEARPARRGRRDGQTTRHGTVAGSGGNQPKHNERKEAAGWVSRQGGDQTRARDEDPGRSAKETGR